MQHMTQLISNLQIVILFYYLMKPSQVNEYPPVEGRSISNRFTLYVLKLEKGRYYVGRAEPHNLQRRISQHRNSDKFEGSAWTRSFKVIQELTSLYQYNKSPFDEDRKVKELMYLYGVNMVRGGSYSQTIDISPQEAEHIMKEIYGATDKCLRCGGSGHWIKDCPLAKRSQEKKQAENQRSQNQQSQNKLINGNRKIKEKIDQIKQEYQYLRCYKCNGYGHFANACDFDNFSQEFRNQYRKSVKCWNCGKYGHYADDCWQIDQLQQQIICYNCNTPGHLSTTCWKKEYQQSEQQIVCYNCNTPGHLSTTCWKKEYQQSESEIVCYNCNTPGHLSTTCWKKSSYKKNYGFRYDNDQDKVYSSGRKKLKFSNYSRFTQ